jgi:Rps23 Pro-64 3,4-dihydroxylase Tpa1-like proline 4-hydroxylase
MGSDPSNSESLTVDVTLLLDGGHQYVVNLQSNAPLLKRLFAVISGQIDTPATQLFQIPLDGGKTALSFRGDRLVGLLTHPPLIVQPAPSGISTQPDVTSDLRTRHRHRPNADPSILPSTYLQLDQFLSPEEHQQLVDYAIHQQLAFASSSTSTGAANYRESLVLHSFPEFADLMRDRIHQAFPDVLTKLDLTPFTITEIEAQLTAHNDQHYYKIHNDNGSPDTATRELTYVYYFYQEPKPFTGGELRIYDSQIKNNYYVKAATFQDIEPRNNSIVFFLSRYMHEVLPISCPSQLFADSRFTINGWIRR